MRSIHALLLCSAICFSQSSIADSSSALSKLPIKEITIFKDGHSFVLHEGTMPVNAQGNVVFDYLPVPIMGAYWPYSNQSGARLSAVTAGFRKISTNQAAMTIPEMIKNNPGGKVHVQEVTGAPYDAEIVGIPERAQPPDPAVERQAPPYAASLVLLKTVHGTTAVALDRIQKLSFRDPYQPSRSVDSQRTSLTMKLEWTDGTPQKNASVGMMYVQKGIRWIPGYKVTVDGKGHAIIKLQATLVNDMVDMTDVTANLVIGVPQFAFKDTPDPISLQSAFAQVVQQMDSNSRTAFGFSNAIGGQMGGMGGGGFGGRSNVQQPATPGPEVESSGKSEDLFVFSVRHITLARGERMVVPVEQFTVDYKDLYTLEIPFSPPSEVRASINSEQQLELAKMLAAPKVKHKIRIKNSTPHPFTTSPALLFNGSRVLSQTLMTYTPIGGEVDIEIATAVDIPVKKKDRETKRTPNANNWQGTTFSKIDLEGSIELSNHKDVPIEVEVKRFTLGNADSVSEGGVKEMLNAIEDGADSFTTSRPTWWGWYGWPNWWFHLNGLNSFTWNLKIEAGKSATVSYGWHYFWP